jgi:integrase
LSGKNIVHLNLHLTSTKKNWTKRKGCIMEKALRRIQPKAVELVATAERVKRHVENDKSDNTRLAYKIHFEDFKRYCTAREFDSLPAVPGVVAMYLADQNELGKSISTLKARLAAISVEHKANGIELSRNPARDELVRRTLRGIQRERGSAQRKKKPLLSDDIKKMIDSLDDGLMGLRDRAIILLGFSGAFRRSELAALEVGDVEFVKAGVLVTVRRSKTDQTGQGHKRGIPYGSNLPTCSVRTLKDWIESAKIESGPLFRSFKKGGIVQDEKLSGQEIARIVIRTAKKAGLPVESLGGHSLRAGFATQAAANKARLGRIMDQGNWRSVSVVKNYIRHASVFRNNAASALEL